MRSSLVVLLAYLAMAGCTGTDPKSGKKEVMPLSKFPSIHQGPFGSCCEDLKTCMAQPNALIRVSEAKTLFLTVGYVRTDKGVGWFDHAIIYCPFCGKHLQDRHAFRQEAEQNKAGSSSEQVE